MIDPENHAFQTPVKINAGHKALAHVPFELSAMGAERPLLVTTRRLGKKRAVLKVRDALKDSGLSMGVFDGIEERAVKKTLVHLAEIYHNGGFDAIIALGGGPVMHTAKVLNLAVTERSNDLAPFTAEGDRRIGRLNPFMAIPASTGDGYDMSPRAFVEDLAFSSRNLMPHIAVVDPDVFMPEAPLEIISDAMAALTHAVEGYVGPEKNPFVDAYAATAIQIIAEQLLNAVGNGRQWRSARAALAQADTIAGCVCANVRPGLTRLLALGISKMTGSPQGLCMGILLPYVLDHLSTRNGFFVDSLLLPMAGAETYAITADNLRCGKVLTLLQELQFSLYEATAKTFPMTLEDVGVKREHLKPLVASLSEDTPYGDNGETRLMILERALRGDPIDIL